MSDDGESSILYAYGGNGALYHVDDVENGYACDCYCPACHQPMNAKNRGEKRHHHYAHQRGATCAWGAEATVVAVARQALEEAGVIALPELTYRDHLAAGRKVVSDPHIMRVVGIEEKPVAGRGAPCLAVTIAGGGMEATYGVCVYLRKGLSEEQAEELYAGLRGVIAVDLGLHMRREARAIGRHYDRQELLLRHQEKPLILEALIDESFGCSSWVRNRRRDELEAKSEAERARRDKLEAERRAREAKERAERERRTAAERKEKETREAAEREAREEKERLRRFDRALVQGIVEEPEEHVVSRPTYDVYCWTTILNDQRERVTVNGGLEAHVLKGDGLRLTLYADFHVDAILEVGWGYRELSRGMSSVVVVFRAAEARGGCDVALGRDSRIHVDGADARLCLFALLGLLAQRHADIRMRLADGREEAVASVDVPGMAIELAR